MLFSVGTGLGVSFLTHVNLNSMAHYKVYSSECGHANFSPSSQLQQSFNQFMLQKEQCEYFSLELALSGRSIQNIYAFFNGSDPNITN